MCYFIPQRRRPAYKFAVPVMVELGCSHFTKPLTHLATFNLNNREREWGRAAYSEGVSFQFVIRLAVAITIYYFLNFCLSSFWSGPLGQIRKAPIRCAWHWAAIMIEALCSTSAVLTYLQVWTAGHVAVCRAELYTAMHTRVESETGRHCLEEYGYPSLCSLLQADMCGMPILDTAYLIEPRPLWAYRRRSERMATSGSFMPELG